MPIFPGIETSNAKKLGTSPSDYDLTAPTGDRLAIVANTAPCGLEPRSAVLLLDDDTLRVVFRLLGSADDVLASSLRELASCKAVCSRWHSLCDEPVMWRHL